MNKILLFSVIFILVLISSFQYTSQQSSRVFSATSDDVVISEVQIAGGTTTDEFIELYNPTESLIDLENWYLSKKTAGGTESDLVSNLQGSIKPHGYYLIAHGAYDDPVAADATYSNGTASLASDNTVTLYDDELNIVDKVGLGSAGDFEGAAAPNPSANKSVERKANGSSTVDSMGAGGADEFLGNGEDSQNNLNDFIIRLSSQPQNFNSPIEPVVGPTPTMTPSPSPIPTSTPTPTDTPSPTPSPSPTPEITPTPSPTPITRTYEFKLLRDTVTCGYNKITIKIGIFTLKVPVLKCNHK
jgi:hypothetical protein